MAKFRMKNGVGTHLMSNGRNIISGDIVECAAADLGGAIDKFDILEPDPAPDARPKVALEIRLRPNSTSWYDVVNPTTGKALNTKALKKAEAELLAGHPYIELAQQPRLVVEEMSDAPGRFSVFDSATNRVVLPGAVPKERAERFVAAYQKLIADGQVHEEAIENIFKAGDLGPDAGGADESEER